MRRSPALLAVGVLALLRPGPAAGAEPPAGLRGADAILAELAKLDPPPAAAAKPAAAGVDTLAALRGDLARFDGAVLPPGEAADGWLALLDRWGALAALPATGPRSHLPFRALLTHLPPPPAWPALTAGLQARAEAERRPARTALLAALAAALGNDEARLDASLTRLAAPGQEHGEWTQFASTLREQMLATTDDTGRAVNLFRALLPPADATEETSYFSSQFHLPDLVTVVGEERAGELLREALRRPVFLETTHAGKRTAALARRLALEMTDELLLPQWELAQDLDAAALFEALDRRFNQHQGAPLPSLGTRVAALAASGTQYARRQADSYYLLGLLAHRRVDDAVAFAKSPRPAEGNRTYSTSPPYEGIQALRSAGRSREVFEFLTRLLAGGGMISSWDTYLSLASDAGRLDEVVALAEQSAARPDLPAADRLTIAKRLGQAYLAADRVEDGVRVLREQIAGVVPGQDAEEAETLTDSAAVGTIGLQLARVGRALDRGELVEEGLRAARASLEAGWRPPEPPSSPADLQRVSSRRSSSSYLARETAALLAETGRGAEAEAVLLGQILADGRREREQRAERLEQFNSNRGMSPSYLRYQLREFGGSRETRSDLVELANLYGQLGRPADVLTLLDRAPNWAADDLGEFPTTSAQDGAPIGYLAARALADSGRAGDARRVLRAMFDHGGAWDPAYQLFVTLAGPEAALAELDAIFAQDRFEERPLIWKAEALLQLGRTEEAETAARAAIAIDPSDGEQGRGRRMQAYTTLAKALVARGKEGDAALPTSAVRAIRLSEDADRFYRAGLLTRAVAMYDQALGIFSDAYCIQSRLAVQLVALGRTEEAEAHYRRAFELMPGSFGRVESHCFGCEGAFDGQPAQSTAEKVFTRLAAETPVKPQVFYLLGYLRKEQGRYAESLAATRRAVELDPDYLNAWNRIDGLARQVHVPRAVTDAATLNVLRLDPNGRHAHGDLSKVHDLRGLWTTVAAAQGHLAPADVRCFPLPASAAASAEGKKQVETLLGTTTPAAGSDGGDPETDEDDDFSRFGSSLRSARLPGPGVVLGRQETLRFIARGLDATAGRR